MKTMICRQFGGACDIEFRAGSFEEIAEQSKQYGVEMMKKKDDARLKSMQEMQARMQQPERMKQWFESKRQECSTAR